jgi:hypothetical protein
LIHNHGLQFRRDVSLLSETPTTTLVGCSQHLAATTKKSAAGNHHLQLECGGSKLQQTGIEPNPGINLILATTVHGHDSGYRRRREGEGPAGPNLKGDERGRWGVAHYISMISCSCKFDYVSLANWMLSETKSQD